VATLKVNGTSIGVMPGPDTVPGAPLSEWAHRSIDIDPALLHPGANVVRVEMSGDVELDRLQIELHSDALFTDGLESGDVSRWSASAP
jgi:hypothetical protein